MGMGSGTKGSGQSQYQSPQQSGFSGKGGGMNAPYNNGGMGGKGGQLQNPYYQQPQMGGLGGKGKGGAQQQQQFQQPIQQSVYQPPVQQNPYASAYFQSQFRPQTFNNPYAQGGFGQQPQGEMSGFGGKGGPMSGFRQQMQQRRMADMMQGQPSGLAALAQPTATTQAATPPVEAPAPEQPYMGNYLQ